MEFLDNSPVTEVSLSEFITMMVRAGKTRAEAKLQAKLAMELGSDVKIGNQMVRIKELPSE